MKSVLLSIVKTLSSEHVATAGKAIGGGARFNLADMAKEGKLLGLFPDLDSASVSAEDLKEAIDGGTVTTEAKGFDSKTDEKWSLPLIGAANAALTGKNGFNDAAGSVARRFAIVAFPAMEKGARSKRVDLTEVRPVTRRQCSAARHAHAS